MTTVQAFLFYTVWLIYEIPGWGWAPRIQWAEINNTFGRIAAARSGFWTVYKLLPRYLYNTFVQAEQQRAQLHNVEIISTHAENLSENNKMSIKKSQSTLK